MFGVVCDIYINDLQVNVDRLVSTFADKTENAGEIKGGQLAQR